MIEQIQNGQAERDALDPHAELRERIEVARRERARIQAEREAAVAARDLQEKLEAEERALKNESAIADAEAAHGPVGKRIAVVETQAGAVILKRPHSALFRRFMDAGETTTDELDKLIGPCLVYPDRSTYDRWAEDEPAITMRAANAICTLAGVRGKELSGK